MRRLLLSAVLLLGACRDGGEPFTVERPATETGRLTFSPFDDRAPAWGTSSDTIFYSGASFPPFNETDGMLFGISRRTSLAAPIVAPVQVGTQSQPWLSAPAVSADGNRVAFFELTSVAFDPVCDQVVPLNGVPVHVNVGRITLQQAVLRVRRLDSTNAADDAALVINFQGRTLDVTQHPNHLEGIIVQDIHPFHLRYELFNTPVFRGSWSPDGTRLVFSDGLQLRIWTVGQTTSTVIPNTADGVLPAWSPDGTQIAFTRLVRGPEIKYSFVCWINVPFVGLQPTFAFDRTIYGAPDTRAAGQLFLIKPDGTGAIQRGNGDAPAWSPDSRFVVVHRTSGLVKVEVSSGTATEIPNTSNGFEPAISRDGKWIAFSRLFAPGNQDIWVASF